MDIFIDSTNIESLEVLGFSNGYGIQNNHGILYLSGSHSREMRDTEGGIRWRHTQKIRDKIGSWAPHADLGERDPASATDCRAVLLPSSVLSGFLVSHLLISSLLMEQNCIARWILASSMLIKV